MQMDRDREIKMEESGQKRRETRYKQSKRLGQFRYGRKERQAKAKRWSDKKHAKVSQ